MLGKCNVANQLMAKSKQEWSPILAYYSCPHPYTSSATSNSRPFLGHGQKQQRQSASALPKILAVSADDIVLRFLIEGLSSGKPSLTDPTDLMPAELDTCISQELAQLQHEYNS